MNKKTATATFVPLKELVVVGKYRLNERQRCLCQQLCGAEQQHYVTDLMIEDHAFYLQLIEDYYCIAEEIAKLQQQGVEPSFFELFERIVFYLPEPWRSFCVMTHSLAACVRRVEDFLADCETAAEIRHIAVLEYYLKSGMLKKYPVKD